VPSKDTQPAPRVSLKGMNRYLNEVESARLRDRRQWVVIAALSVSVAALSIGLATLSPLKERVPYFLEVEKATGRVEVSGQVAQRFEANEQAVRYFLGRWVQDAFTIDEATRQRILTAYSYMRGPGIVQFERLLDTEDPLGKLQQSSAFRRSVEIVTPPQIVADGSVLIRIQLVEGRDVVARKQISLRYVLIPPRDDDDILRNPIGLWITDLNVVNEAL